MCSVSCMQRFLTYLFGRRSASPVSGNPSDTAVSLIEGFVMINVVCASDLGFIAHMATMLRSLVENSSREEICIFILLDNQLNDDDKI